MSAWLIWIGIALIVRIAVGIWGRYQERKQLAEFDEREARVAHVLVLDTRKVPDGMTAEYAFLIEGSSVMGMNLGKQLAASLKSIVGGELESFRRTHDRTRRQAEIRMREEAAWRDAKAIINVRYETSRISKANAASEVLCYGTMVK